MASSVPSIVPIWILNNSFKTLTLLRCSIFVHIKVCNVIQEPKITRSWPITKKIPKISQPFLIFIRVEYRFESLDLFFFMATVLATSGIRCDTPKKSFVFHICTLTTWTLQIKYNYLRLVSAEIPNTFQEFLLYFICEFKYFVQDFNLEIPLLIVTLSAYLYCPGAHELNRLAILSLTNRDKGQKIHCNH